jgi:hypothetical protein
MGSRWTVQVSRATLEAAVREDSVDALRCYHELGTELTPRLALYAACRGADACLEYIRDHVPLDPPDCTEDESYSEDSENCDENWGRRTVPVVGAAYAQVLSGQPFDARVVAMLAAQDLDVCSLEFALKTIECTETRADVQAEVLHGIVTAIRHTRPYYDADCATYLIDLGTRVPPGCLRTLDDFWQTVVADALRRSAAQRVIAKAWRRHARSTDASTRSVGPIKDVDWTA